MSPLELIRIGILEQNFAKVAEGYEGLTGQVLTEAKPATSTKKNKIKAKKPKSKVIETPNEELVEEEVVDEYDVSNFKPIKSKYSEIILPGEQSGSAARKESVNVNKIKRVGNLFTDDGTIDAALRKKYQKENKEHIPSPRMRPPVQFKVYRCDGGCGRQFKLNPIYAPNDRYVCNKCRGL